MIVVAALCDVQGTPPRPTTVAADATGPATPIGSGPSMETSPKQWMS
jgi:hypothetical protein